MKTRLKTTRIIVHHSASIRSTTPDEIRKWHVEDRGFEEVGYHYIVDGAGTMHRGRDIHRIGAHCLGANDDSIGICVTGDNTKTDAAHLWSGAQIDELRLLIATLQDVFGPLTIHGHRDVGETATECPGLNVQDVL